MHHEPRARGQLGRIGGGAHLLGQLHVGQRPRFVRSRLISSTTAGVVDQIVTAWPARADQRRQRGAEARRRRRCRAPRGRPSGGASLLLDRRLDCGMCAVRLR